MTVLYWYMIFARRIMLPLLRTRKVLINTPTQSGKFNGSAREKVIKVKVLSVFQLMVGLLSGRWRKVFSIQIWCCWDVFLSPTKKMLLKTWTSDLPVDFHSNSWKDSHRCTWPPLKKESFIAALRVTPNNILKYTQGTMDLSIKSKPILSFMIFSWPARPIGVVNYGIGGEIAPWTHSKVLTFMTRLSILSGALTNPLYLHLSAKMEDLSYGTI